VGYYQVNVLRTVFVSQAVVPAMIWQGKGFVHIASKAVAVLLFASDEADWSPARGSAWMVVTQF